MELRDLLIRDRVLSEQEVSRLLRTQPKMKFKLCGNELVWTGATHKFNPLVVAQVDGVKYGLCRLEPCGLPSGSVVGTTGITTLGGGNIRVEPTKSGKDTKNYGILHHDCGGKVIWEDRPLIRHLATCTDRGRGQVEYLVRIQGYGPVGLSLDDLEYICQFYRAYDFQIVSKPGGQGMDKVLRRRKPIKVADDTGW